MDSPADLWAWVDAQPTHPTQTDPRRHRPLLPGPLGRYLVEGLCGWELVALVTGLLPTISSVCQPHQKRWTTRVAVVAPLLVLAHHLLIESPATKEKPC